MAFPDNCIKGIPNKKDFMLEDGSIASHLFSFKEEHNRDDGWCEQSINWEDDNLAIQFTLNQKKENGDWQFKAGIVLLPRTEIDRLNKQPTVNGILSYERRERECNCYHGNILLRSDTPKPTKRKIAAGLALSVSELILREKT